jgi:hypothetical protein
MTTASKSTSKSAETQKQSFWQMILLYPALALALISAAPEWIKSINAWRNDVTKTQLERGIKQQQFVMAGVTKQLPCLFADQLFHTNPDGLQIDATICDTGDIVLKVVKPAFPENINNMSVIFIDDVVSGNTLSAGIGAFGAANAAPLIEELRSKPRFTQSIPKAANIELAQTLEVLICQKPIDSRFVLRHVRVGNECFDEKWDTLTGNISQRVETKCRSSC